MRAVIGRAECHVWVEVSCDWWTRVTVLIEMFRDWLILNLILITVFCDWSIRINCYGRGWFCFWRELRHEPGRSLCLLCSVEKDICEIRKLPFINQDEMDIFFLSLYVCLWYIYISSNFFLFSCKISEEEDIAFKQQFLVGIKFASINLS